MRPLFTFRLSPNRLALLRARRPPLEAGPVRLPFRWPPALLPLCLMLAILAFFACGPEHPNGAASPCVAAYEEHFDASQLIGTWSKPPCEGHTGATCQLRTVDVDGDKRCYLQPVPQFDTAGLPLVIVWHGSDSNGESYRRAMNTDIEGLKLEAAIGEEAMIVYPQGRAHADCGGTSCWNRDPEGPDVAFFDALVVQVVAEWGIDADAVFSIGHSRGGRFVEVLGCFRADEHAAIAMISAGNNNVDGCPGKLPLWLSQGIHDETIPLSAGVTHLEHWAERNGCDPPEPDTYPDDVCTALSNCEHALQWCPTTGGEWGGHAPPTIADEAIWSFFARQLR